MGITHLITLSGNSKRFTEKGYEHKALCKVNGFSMVEMFVKSFKDFHEHENIFLCRNEDLDSTRVKEEINKHAGDAKVLGIESNDLGPVYSISKIFERLDDDRPILISYIDTLQQTSIGNMLESFDGYDGGMTIHDFNNPHWRTSKSYCLVEHDEFMNVTNVVEKYPFKDADFLDKHKSGSSGNYFFQQCGTMKHYCNLLMSQGIKVNNEFYITQAMEDMVKDGLKVKAHLCPYAALGTPEDLEDYGFWMRWFNDFNIS